MSLFLTDHRIGYRSVTTNETGAPIREVEANTFVVNSCLECGLKLGILHNESPTILRSLDSEIMDATPLVIGNSLLLAMLNFISCILPATKISEVLFRLLGMLLLVPGVVITC